MMEVVWARAVLPGLLFAAAACLWLFFAGILGGVRELPPTAEDEILVRAVRRDLAREQWRVDAYAAVLAVAALLSLVWWWLR